MKHKHKTMLIDKAIYHIIPIMEGLMKGEVQVIAFDLPRDLLKRMSEANTWVDEQGFKKLQEVAGIGQKDTLTRARCAIQKLIELSINIFTFHHTQQPNNTPFSPSFHPNTHSNSRRI